MVRSRIYVFNKECMRNGITFYWTKRKNELVDFIWIENERQGGYKKWWDTVKRNPEEEKLLWLIKIN